jgi:hypothetical protein
MAKAKESAQPNKVLETTGISVGEVMLAGSWSEPEAPPPATAVLDLGLPQTRVDKLLLRANIPSTVALRGPADLLFRAFSIRLTARGLVRNLAKADWGTSRSVTADAEQATEFLLAGPARITAIGVRTPGPPKAGVAVRHKEAGLFQSMVESLGLYSLYVGKGAHSGYHERAVVTDAFRFSLTDPKAEYLLASPSLPSRVGIALGDDTPAQLFPNEMAKDGTVTSRDLTAAINAAWKRGTADQNAEVQLRITSLTDGVVQVDLAGAWGRSHAGQETRLLLDGINTASLTLAWPFVGVPAAQVWLRLTGAIDGGRRLGLSGDGAPAFHVRTTERLEVAQAFRIASGDLPVAKRRLLAVWLMLPRLPRAEERVELRLAAAAGDPIFPADQPLARFEVALPVDATAYVARSGGYWYRAALAKPIELDGTQAASPLFVVAAGRGDGSLLAHRGLGLEPGGADRLSASLVRNLERTGGWAVQGFNRQASRWLVDLELEPLPAECASLLAVACGAGPAQGLPLAGGNRVSLETAPLVLAAPPGGSLTFTLRSAVRAALTGQIVLYKPVLG